VGTTFNFTIGEQTALENFDFSVMIAIWEDNTFLVPSDLEKIGKLKF
jgi:hypothetical protein